MRKSLSIFKHKKGLCIPIDSLLLIILTGIVFLFSYLEQTGNFDFGYCLTFFLSIWLIYFISYLISRFFLYELEHGEYGGKLLLKESSISINKIEYDLEEIKNIKIHSTDIRGEFIGYTYEFSRKLSNGLKNNIIITLKNGKKIDIYFLQTEREKIKSSKKELINYYKKGKFSWLHLLDILEITDYDKIQIFKKEINND